jgi:hypothetical protein
MDDALVVSGFEGLCDLLGDAERFVNRDWSARNAFIEALAVHEFEHEELRTVGFV